MRSEAVPYVKVLMRRFPKGITKMATVITERITKTPGVCGGKACIAGHRIRVMDIVIRYEHMGMSADEIVTDLPTISLSDVHSAMAYYYDHIEEIRKNIQDEREFANEFKKKYASALEERLRRMRSEDAA
jgi:uncharacterized protein (DUF433 family)